MIVRKWAIYRAELDPVIGSEQGKSRPVLVISEDIINDLLNIVNVIPITSRNLVEQYIRTKFWFLQIISVLVMILLFFVIKFERSTKPDFQKNMDKLMTQVSR